LSTVQPCVNPEDALLNRYNRLGGYTDCYSVEVPFLVPFGTFVEAFYTTWIFKLERLILKLLVAKPSSDAQARQLAKGKINKFAAWTVEDKADNQLMMCDFQKKTRSFFMVRPHGENSTRLFFGSAIVATEQSKQGDPTLSLFFKCLLGFHKYYSIILLSAARRKLAKSIGSR